MTDNNKSKRLSLKDILEILVKFKIAHKDYQPKKKNLILL